MIITRTPFRISFFGGGTDYPAWYQKYGGAVLATTINKYCYLTCRYLPPFFDHRIRVVYSKIESCQSVDEIGHPAVREVLRHVGVERGVEIHHDGDLPARSGMGSSSSFTVGLLNAMYALQGRMVDKRQLALESIFIEQARLKEVVGSQDQVSASYGGLNHIIFFPDGEISVRPVTISSERIKLLDDHLMLFYTGIARMASTVAQTYVQDIDGNERHLRKIREMVDAGLSILDSKDDITRFGELLHESWQLKRSLSPLVSNSHVEQIYEEARTAGAIGGKLTGAGGGGFLLLFVPPSHQPAVREKLNKLICVPFKFTLWGSQVIFFDPEEDHSDAEQWRLSQPLQAFRDLASIVADSAEQG